MSNDQSYTVASAEQLKGAQSRSETVIAESDGTYTVSTAAQLMGYPKPQGMASLALHKQPTTDARRKIMQEVSAKNAQAEHNFSPKHSRRVAAKMVLEDSNFKNIYFLPNSSSTSSISLSAALPYPQGTKLKETTGCKNVISVTPAKHPASEEGEYPSPTQQEEIDFVTAALKHSSLIQAYVGQPSHGTHDAINHVKRTQTTIDRTDSPTVPATLHSHGLLSQAAQPKPKTNRTTRHDRAQSQRHKQRATPPPSAPLPLLPTAQPSQTVPTLPSLPLPTLFTSVALCDPNISNQPIRHLTTTFVHGSNMLRVGSCTFLNLPHGTALPSQLRIEPSSATRQGQRIILQLVQRVLDANAGNTVWFLCSDVDVTTAFEPLGRARATLWQKRVDLSPTRHGEVELEAEMLASHLNKEGHAHDNSPHDSGAFIRRNGVEEEKRYSDVWMAVAAEIMSSSSLHTSPASPLAAADVATLQATQPAYADLLSLLSEIKLLHSVFFVIRITATRKAGPNPAGISMQNKDSLAATSTTDPVWKAMLAASYSATKNESKSRVNAATDIATDINIPAGLADCELPSRFTIPWLSPALAAQLSSGSEAESRGADKREAFRNSMASQLTRGMWEASGGGAARRVVQSVAWDVCGQQMKGVRKTVVAVPLKEDSGRSRSVSCWVGFVVEEGMEGVL